MAQIHSRRRSSPSRPAQLRDALKLLARPSGQPIGFSIRDSAQRIPSEGVEQLTGERLRLCVKGRAGIGLQTHAIAEPNSPQVPKTFGSGQREIFNDDHREGPPREVVVEDLVHQRAVGPGGYDGGRVPKSEEGFCPTAHAGLNRDSAQANQRDRLLGVGAGRVLEGREQVPKLVDADDYVEGAASGVAGMVDADELELPGGAADCQDR